MRSIYANRTGLKKRNRCTWQSELKFGFPFSDNLNSRAAWWLELRTEALTHMQNVGCDALIGYREECAIYEDVCVLSVYATAVSLNHLWMHAPPPPPAPSMQTGPNRASGRGEAATTGQGKHYNLLSCQ